MKRFEGTLTEFYKEWQEACAEAPQEREEDITITWVSEDDGEWLAEFKWNKDNSGSFRHKDGRNYEFTGLHIVGPEPTPLEEVQTSIQMRCGQ